MINIFGIIVGLIILTLLVVIHEFGHFIAAKKNGVTVKEFGIGLPPRAIAWVKKDKKWRKLPTSEWEKDQKSLIFSLNWLPLGGFCAMDGESDSDKRPHTFGSASFWGKTKILFAGVALNWLTAIIILSILAVTGLPKIIENQFYLNSDTKIDYSRVFVKTIEEGSPAQLAGFKENDQILKANEEPIYTNFDLVAFNNTNAGQQVSYTIKRDESTQVLPVKLNDKSKDYLLGITMNEVGVTTYRSTWSAPLVGLVTTIQITGETFKGLSEMLWNFASGLAKQFSFNESERISGQNSLSKASKAVSGPVGIIGVIFPAFTSAGLTELSLLTAIISISLACMNVLPIPALDGGRWLLIAIYKLRKKILTKELETKIVSRAFMVLIALVFLITILDIIKIIK